MPSKLPSFALLALTMLLGIAAPAQALSLPAVGEFAAPSALVAPGDEEEEESEAEASEDEELEAEECEAGEEEDCEEEGSMAAPSKCPLSSVEPAIFASGNSGKVRLQIRYSTSAPAAVAIAYGLHGTKGSLFLGDEKKRFVKQGVLRLSRNLNEAQMDKVMAAKNFTVRIRILKAPGSCQSLFERHLTLRRATPSGLSWLPSE